MSRFINVNGLHINTDRIAQYWEKPDKGVCIMLTDGDVETVPPNKVYDLMEDLDGAFYIVQIIPAPELLYLVRKDEDDGSYWATPVYYLALCADGAVRALDNVGGYFETTLDGYGVYYKYQLNQFPNIHFDDDGDTDLTFEKPDTKRKDD